MTVELFHGVRWVDVMIHRKLGVAHNALPGVGLVVEIVRHLQEARDLDSTSVIRTVLAVTLFVLLLLHQLAELAEHVGRRFRKSRQVRQVGGAPAEAGVLHFPNSSRILSHKMLYGKSLLSFEPWRWR